MSALSDAKISAGNAFDGAVRYEATENVVTVTKKGTADSTGRAHIRQGTVYKAADSYTAKAEKKIVNTGDSLIIGASMQYEFGDESKTPPFTSVECPTRSLSHA